MCGDFKFFEKRFWVWRGNFKLFFSLGRFLADSFIGNNDYIYITIDLDGFSSAFTPGVSAPSPIGMNPKFVMSLLEFILSSKKVISCDIAEMNPNFDQDNSTANLAARLIDHIVGRLEV